MNKSKPKECLLNCGEIRPEKRSLFAAVTRETNLKCLLLTVLVVASSTATFFWCGSLYSEGRGKVLIPTALILLLYLLYLVECWHSKAREMITSPKIDVNTVYRKVEEMRRARPVVWWQAVCYHFERRTQQFARYRHPDVSPTFHASCDQERVITHTSASSFFYGRNGVHDISRDLIDLEKFAVTQVQFKKAFIFHDSESASEFQDQRASFFQDIEDLDSYVEMREGMELGKVMPSEKITCWTDAEEPPWFGRLGVFWLCSFLLLSWPLRVVLELNTAHLIYQITKLFGKNCDCHHSSTANTSASSNPRSIPKEHSQSSWILQWHWSQLLPRIVEFCKKKVKKYLLNRSRNSYNVHSRNISQSSDHSSSSSFISHSSDADYASQNKNSARVQDQHQHQNQKQPSIFNEFETNNMSGCAIELNANRITSEVEHSKYENVPVYLPPVSHKIKNGVSESVPRSVTLLLSNPLEYQITKKDDFDRSFGSEFLRNDCSDFSECSVVPSYSQAMLLMEMDRCSDGQSQETCAVSENEGVHVPSVVPQEGSFTVTEANVHPRDRIRRSQSQSFRVLRTRMPRSATGVSIDLTVPVSASFTRDQSSPSPHDLTQDDLQAPPPTYTDALRTSRPVFLPHYWTKLRRCLTQRDLSSSSFSSLRVKGQAGHPSRRRMWLQDVRPTFLFGLNFKYKACETENLA